VGQLLHVGDRVLFDDVEHQVVALAGTKVRRRSSTPLGRADQRVVEAIREPLDGETSRATGTVDRLRRRVEAILAKRHGDGGVPLPSRATFYRLVNSGDWIGPSTSAMTSRSIGAVPRGT
jgi:hypothetical protein